MPKAIDDHIKDILGKELFNDLADLAQAHHSAYLPVMVRIAVFQFIMREISDNAGVRDLYHSIQRQRLARNLSRDS